MNFIKKILSPSITVRLTLTLTLFAFLISYVSLTLNSIVASHRFIIQMGKTVSEHLQISGITGQGTIQDALVGKRNNDFAGTMNFLKKNLEGARIIFSVCFFDRHSKRWKELRHNESGIFYAVPVRGGLAADLENNHDERVVIASGLFLGKSDRVSMLINTYPISRGKGFVVHLDAEREGVIHLLKQYLPHASGFAALLFIVSFLLSRHMARRITRPVIEIAHGASAVAAGDYSYRFEVQGSDEIGVLASSLNVMTTSIADHISEVESRMNAMETMNSIDKAVLSSISRKDLLDRVTGIVSSLFHTENIALVLRNRERAGFDVVSYYRGGTDRIPADKPFVPDSKLSVSFLGRAETMFQLSDEEAHSIRELDLFSDALSDKFGTLINIPIIMSDTYIGSLGISRRQGSGFTAAEMETARILADQVGVALQSVHEYEEKENLLLGILLALTRSIDAKSRWTAGHSERVAQYVEAMGGVMHYDESTLTTLKYSAILHDIGKIAVPEQILDKPAQLTDEEYDVVKKHPGVGSGIIADIPSYDAILPGILYHHERWDGRGYPEGLKGDNIPVFGRIIAVADVYDAITADRPYRKGMSRDDAIVFMRENSGTMFDPDIAALFIKMIEEGLDVAETVSPLYR